jgi:hypothetical protein
MNLTPDDAQAALNDIRQATAQTHYLLKAWLYSVLVVGVVWSLAFAVAQWQPLSPIWSAGENILVGVVCSVLFWQRRVPVVRFTPGSRRAFVHNRLPVFYGILYAFFLLWRILFHLSTMQQAVLWITVVMLAAITTGLLLQQRLFIVCGLGITVMTILGYWIVPDYFWVWIAAFAGLPLIGVSIYLLRHQ